MTSPSTLPRLFRLPSWALFLINLGAIALVATFTPTEKTLGANIRLILVHGVWVWAGLLSYLAAAITGSAGLVRGRGAWAGWSLAFGRTGLAFWLTYLPMSLLVMQLNWGGFYFDEPRWRIPFAYAVAGVLLQIGLAVFNHPRLTCAANLAFGAALWYSTIHMESILHPDSPILTSDSLGIQVFFGVLLILALCAAGQVARWFYRGAALSTAPK